MRDSDPSRPSVELGPVVESGERRRCGTDEANTDTQIGGVVFSSSVQDGRDRPGTDRKTACPGPLAYQLGVYCGYITHGVLGDILVALSFAVAPFVIVTAAATIYDDLRRVRIDRLDLRTLLWIGPAVVALIFRAWQ